MPNLFDDAPSIVAPPDNLFADAPDLATAPEANLFEDAPLDHLSPEARQSALKYREQIATPEKMLLGAQLGAVEGGQELKRAAGGLLMSPVAKLPMELQADAFALGVKAGDYILGRKPRETPNPITQKRQEIGLDISEAATKEIESIAAEAEDLSPRKWVQIPKLLSQGVVSTIPSLAVAPFTGLTGASLTAGLQSFGSTYSTAYRKYAETMSPEEARAKALTPAIASGLVTAGATRTFGGLERLLEKVGAGKLAKENLVGVLKQIAKSAFLEIPEEGLDQLGQGMIEQKSYNPDKSWGEIVHDSLVAAAVGGGVGLLVGGVAAPGGAAVNRYARGQRLKQLRAERPGMVAARRAEREETVRRELTDRIMAVEKGMDAQRTSPVNGPLQYPTAGVPASATEAVPAPTTVPDVIPPSDPAPTVPTAPPCNRRTWLPV